MASPKTLALRNLTFPKQPDIHQLALMKVAEQMKGNFVRIVASDRIYMVRKDGAFIKVLQVKSKMVRKLYKGVSQLGTVSPQPGADNLPGTTQSPSTPAVNQPEAV